MKILSILAVAMLLAGAPADGPAQESGRLTNRLMLDGVYTRHLGEFGDVWASNSGVTVSYGIAFPEHNLLVFRTGYLSSTLADSVAYPDAKLDVIPLHVGGRYYFLTDRVMPFAAFMTGMNVIFENTGLEGEKVDRTHAKFAWELGFGATVNVAGNIAIDASASYNSHFYTHEAMATGFAYTVGVAWNFRE
jgi:opacity protein-like surface antigen